MPRFAANLSMMYNELPFPERFAAAAADGFEAVEYLFPYQWTPTQLAGWLRDAGLQQVLFNAPPGGTDTASIDAAWQAGSRGIASLPGREAEFRNGFL
ncbi:MAG: hydroxypyruvate isomerase, partial [Betaproteobacteria bacterium]|nr:hydroxypyruvate isomerase [Betaproteobacteria bacterium]